MFLFINNINLYSNELIKKSFNVKKNFFQPLGCFWLPSYHIMRLSHIIRLFHFPSGSRREKPRINRLVEDPDRTNSRSKKYMKNSESIAETWQKCRPAGTKGFPDCSVLVSVASWFQQLTALVLKRYCFHIEPGLRPTYSELAKKIYWKM